jgi:hypothetical protein
MEWPTILVLILAVPIILFPAAFVWYLNAGGLYAAIKEGRISVPRGVIRTIRLVLIVTVPGGIYGGIIWFTLGHFGWAVALAVALVLPVVLIAPVLVWAALASGLYQVARDALHRRAAARKRRATLLAEEATVRVER